MNSAEEVRQRFRTPRLSLVLDMAEVWFNERSVITFHDPLAAATLFDQSFVRFERGTVDVELLDQAELGRTRLVQSTLPGEAKHEFAVAVDRHGFSSTTSAP